MAKPKTILGARAITPGFTHEGSSIMVPGRTSDVGEAEAIALARHLHADWFLTDDAAARLFSQSLGVEVHGSLGVVLWASAVGELTQVDAEAILNRLANSSLWISAKILAEAKAALRKLYR